MKLRTLALLALLLLPAGTALAITENPGLGGEIPLGKLVSRPPSGSEKVSVGLTTYHYADGLFYRKSGKSWLVVQPPKGAVVRRRPPRSVPVMALGTRFYYQDGFFYRRRSHASFEVIRAPAGAVVKAIPRHAQRRVVGGEVQYYYAGVTYVPQSKGGRTTYKVLAI